MAHADPQPGVVRQAADYVVAVARRFFEDRSVQTAGSLTFTTLLSLVPLLTVTLSMATAFPVFDQAIASLQNTIVKNFLPDASGVEAITRQITAFTQKAGRLTAIGLAFLAITALMLMLTIDEAMNRVFRVQRRRPLAQRILMYWSVLSLGPVLIGASLSMTTFVVGASLGALDLGWLAQLVLQLLPFLFTCTALTMLYVVVPNRRIEVWHAIVGALFAGLSFELAKRGFAFYIAKFPTYTLIYGAFATIPIFLLWVYLSWLVVLAGATITAMLPGWRGAAAEHRRGPGQDLLDALAVLTTLARAQQHGRVRRLTRLAAQVRMLPHRCETVLERCARLGWVAHTDRDGWLLARPADAIRVADVYRAFVLDPDTRFEDVSDRLSEHWRHVERDFDVSIRDLIDTPREADGAAAPAGAVAAVPR